MSSVRKVRASCDGRRCCRATLGSAARARRRRAVDPVDVGGARTAFAMVVGSANVSLLRWLRRQLAEPGPFRERLEAAVEHDDPAEVRRLLAGLPFSEGQRRYVERLLDAWERERRVDAGGAG